VEAEKPSKQKKGIPPEEMSEEDKRKLAEILSKYQAEIVFGLSEELQNNESSTVEFRSSTTEPGASASFTSSSGIVLCRPCFPGATFDCWRRV